MNIYIKNGRILINNKVEVILLQTKASVVKNIVDTDNRLVNLNYGIELVIFSKMGIRIWSKNDIIYQLGIVYQTDTDDKNMPSNEFNGFFEVDGTLIKKETEAKEIVKKMNLKIDEDSLRFKVELYNGFIEDFKISILVNKRERIKNLFITKPNISKQIISGDDLPKKSGRSVFDGLEDQFKQIDFNL